MGVFKDLVQADASRTLRAAPAPDKGFTNLVVERLFGSNVNTMYLEETEDEGTAFLGEEANDDLFVDDKRLWASGKQSKKTRSSKPHKHSLSRKQEGKNGNRTAKNNPCKHCRSTGAAAATPRTPLVITTRSTRGIAPRGRARQ